MAKERGGNRPRLSVGLTGLRKCHVFWSDKNWSRKPREGRKEESEGLEGERGDRGMRAKGDAGEKGEEESWLAKQIYMFKYI